MYLPLYKVADTPFHIQGDDIAHSLSTRYHNTLTCTTVNPYTAKNDNSIFLLVLLAEQITAIGNEMSVYTLKFLFCLKVNKHE